jgi:hypothetical protein
VLATLVINTIIGLGPIIFVKLGEKNVGEYDAILIPNDMADKFEINSFNNDQGMFVNYTHTSILEK